MSGDTKAMNASAETSALRQDEIVPERLARKAARSDFYFRPDPWVSGLVESVEKCLRDVIDSGTPLIDEIGLHMLFGCAKRLRPIFVLLSQNLFRDEVLPSAIKCAAVAELIHCATLFHDDVIDEAGFRKGKQSANSLWGNKNAVIVGDHFFVLAYELLSKLRDFRMLEMYIDMCRSIARGVVMEIAQTGQIDTTEETHLDIIRQKTAIFFETSAVVGGYLGGAEPEQERHLAGFGLNFGFAFQLSDDLLDLFCDPDATGKPRGSDLKSGIYTTSVIHALREDERFADEFRPVLEKGEITQDGVIDKIAGALKSNGAMEYVIDLVKLHGEKAISHLDNLPPGKANDTFRDLLNKITSREYC